MGTTNLNVTRDCVRNLINKNDLMCEGDDDLNANECVTEIINIPNVEESEVFNVRNSLRVISKVRKFSPNAESTHFNKSSKMRMSRASERWRR